MGEVLNLLSIIYLSVALLPMHFSPIQAHFWKRKLAVEKGMLILSTHNEKELSTHLHTFLSLLKPDTHLFLLHGWGRPIFKEIGLPRSHLI